MIILRNCTIIDNTTAGILADDGNVVRLENSRIINSGTAIDGPTELHVIKSEILRNLTAGVSAVNAFPWIFEDSLVEGNTTGLTTSNGTTGTGRVLVNRSRISSNLSHGIFLTNAATILSVRDSVISLNSDDGIRLRGLTGSSFHVAGTTIESNGDDGINIDNMSDGCGTGPSRHDGVVVDSHIATNGDDGIEIDIGNTGCEFPAPVPATVACGLLRTTIVNNTGHGIAEVSAHQAIFQCELGHNSLFANVAGNEGNTGGTVCTGLGSSENQTE